MFEDYKKDLIKVFKRLYDEGAFSGLFDKLSQSDHYIKIRYSTVNALDDAGDKPEHPLCYLYNHKLIFDRKSFLQERGTFLPNDDIPPDIFDDDLLVITSIASSTVLLFENYFYKVIEKAEKRYEIKVKELTLNNRVKEMFGFDFYPDIFFYSYDILLFALEDSDGLHDGLYYNERNKRPIEKLKMKNATLRDKYLFHNIREEGWYNNLESLTKKNINSFYGMVENTNFEKFESKAVDFSPYLIPLYKATEVEFDHHYKYYSEDIVESATAVLTNAENHWNHKLRKKYNILLTQCKKMVEKRGNFKKNGFHTAYLVLYHLALGKELKLEHPFKSYLNQKQFIELNRNSEIISDISRESQNRNLLVHQDVLRSGLLFRKSQNLMISILQILGILKDYKDID
jgi:hypothetical protein